jgi:hypothetical protein
MSSFKVFDKAALQLANKIAIKRGYNRAIVEDYIAGRPDNSHWVVTFHMLHEHAAGKPVDPHVRCMIQQLFVENPPTLFVDTDMSLFELLPEISTENEEGKPAEKESAVNG